MPALDLDALVLGPCVAAFGEAAQGYPVPVYTPAAGAPFALDGVFDRGYREIDQLTGVPISTAMPVLGVRLAQFPAGVTPQPNDHLTIRGVTYLVREVRPDGHGHARLMLSRA